MVVSACKDSKFKIWSVTMPIFQSEGSHDSIPSLDDSQPLGQGSGQFSPLASQSDSRQDTKQFSDLSGHDAESRQDTKEISDISQPYSESVPRREKPVNNSLFSRFQRITRNKKKQVETVIKPQYSPHPYTTSVTMTDAPT